MGIVIAILLVIFDYNFLSRLKTPAGAGINNILFIIIILRKNINIEELIPASGFIIRL